MTATAARPCSCSPVLRLGPVLPDAAALDCLGAASAGVGLDTCPALQLLGCPARHRLPGQRVPPPAQAVLDAWRLQAAAPPCLAQPQLTARPVCCPACSGCACSQLPAGSCPASLATQWLRRRLSCLAGIWGSSPLVCSLASVCLAAAALPGAASAPPAFRVVFRVCLLPCACSRPHWVVPPEPHADAQV